MNDSRRPVSRETGLNFFCYLPLIGILAFAPLIKGGNRPLPLLVLEILGVILLLGAFASPIPAGQLPIRLTRIQLLLLGSIPLLPLFHMLSLPEVVWQWLPGRHFYGELLGQSTGTTPDFAVALLPQNAQASLLALIPSLAVFLATLKSSEQQLKRLTKLIVIIAVGQSIIGLAQFGTGSIDILGPVAGEPLRGAYGTYANPDHLAGFLEMVLPLVVALLFSNTQVIFPQAKISRSRRKRNWKKLVQQLIASGSRFNQLIIYLMAALIILLGLTFTHSRAGFGLGMLGLLIGVLILGRQLGRQLSGKITLIVVVTGILIAGQIGVMSVLGRFSVQGLTSDLRWSIYGSTLRGVIEFFPLGAGLGSFPEVFVRFQPAGVAEFVNHAHNDYLEWLFEGGLPALLILGVFFYCYQARWKKLWSADETFSSYQQLRLAAGISCALMALHELVDFNLHIPANAIYFGFIAGIFFHRERIHHHKLRSKSSSRHATHQRTRFMAAAPPQPTPGEVPNPFSRQSEPGQMPNLGGKS